MLEKEYLNKLSQYIGGNINVSEKPNEIIIGYDIETRYVLKKEQMHYVLYVEVRNLRDKIAVFHTELEMKRKFALYMRNIFGTSIEYLHTEEIEMASDITSLRNIVSRYLENKFYSIDHLEKNKINLEKKAYNLYDVFFLNENGEKKFIEQNQSAPYIFGRFYNEIVFLKETLLRIYEYETIFGDALNYVEKFQILAY